MFIYGTFLSCHFFFHVPCKQEETSQHNVPFRNKLMAQFGVNFTAQWSESDLAACPHTPRRRSTESAQPDVAHAVPKSKISSSGDIMYGEKAVIIQMPLELAGAECRKGKQARTSFLCCGKLFFWSHAYTHQWQGTVASLWGFDNVQKQKFSLTDVWELSNYFNSFPWFMRGKNHRLQLYLI